MRTRTVVLAAICMLWPTIPLAAQDPFEIVVYPAATAARGEWELETHLNYTARGTTAFNGTVAPSQRQTHLTFEMTHGITANWEASVYVLTAYRPGVGAEYAGWRLRSRVHAPAQWQLPLDLGFSAELEAPRPAYGGASPTVELTPILEKQFGALRLGLNANFERDLGAGEAGGTEEGWEFEPSALVAYRVSPSVTARLEYHGAFGELGGGGCFPDRPRSTSSSPASISICATPSRSAWAWARARPPRVIAWSSLRASSSSSEPPPHRPSDLTGLRPPRGAPDEGLMRDPNEGMVSIPTTEECRFREPSFDVRVEPGHVTRILAAMPRVGETTPEEQ